MMRRPTAWISAAATVAVVVGATTVAVAVTIGSASGVERTDVSAGVITEGTGDAQLDLPPVAAGVSHVVATFGCGSPGDFRWGPADAEPATSECGLPLLATGARFTTFDFLIDEPPGAFRIEADVDDAWTLTLRFLPDEPEVEGINAAGESFGVAGVYGVQPDLVRVPVIDGRGDVVSGYARSLELSPPLPASESETLRNQADRDAAFPDGRPVTVYRADGTTVLGSFIVQGG